MPILFCYISQVIAQYISTSNHALQVYPPFQQKILYPVPSDSIFGRSYKGGQGGGSNYDAKRNVKNQLT